MTTEVQLPKVVQTRIARLARAAGRSPAATLRFVLRDGFDAVEQRMRAWGTPESLNTRVRTRLPLD